VTCVDFAPADTNEAEFRPCSWESIASAVRLLALSQPAEEAADLERFAELLDGFAELEKQCDS
jgi:hypothetical protein